MLHVTRLYHSSGWGASVQRLTRETASRLSGGERQSDVVARAEPVTAGFQADSELPKTQHRVENREMGSFCLRGRCAKSEQQALEAKLHCQ